MDCACSNGFYPTTHHIFRYSLIVKQNPLTFIPNQGDLFFSGALEFKSYVFSRLRAEELKKSSFEKQKRHHSIALIPPSSIGFSTRGSDWLVEVFVKSLVTRICAPSTWTLVAVFSGRHQFCGSNAGTSRGPPLRRECTTTYCSPTMPRMSVCEWVSRHTYVYQCEGARERASEWMDR